jgi:serine/threonine-protein kinase
MNAPVHIGEVLAGKYRVERVLGAGGMGVVVAAWHLQLEERVAIKFLQPEALKDPSVVARFLREGRAAVKIRSEHVARVYDVGNLDNGAPYLVMEHLDGSDLAQLVKSHGPFPLHIAVEYLLQACEAIAEAHAIGIVHRDFKPANLFITTRRDGSPAVKVIDFGISKLMAGAGEGLDITKTLEVRGSPLFMSPEQMTSPRAVDTRTDIWSIGVSLYNLLTGGYPFYATALTELCGIVLQQAPVPLRTRRPDLPAGIEAVILRCLRKNPAERYTDVAELAAALGEFAPPLARLSVDRIHRVLRAPAVQTRGSLPSTPAIEPTPSAFQAPEDVPTRPLAPSAPAGAPHPALGMQAPAEAESWGSTKILGVKRSTAVWLTAILLGLTGGGAIVLVLWLRWPTHAVPELPFIPASPELTAPAAPLPPAVVEVAASAANPSASPAPAASAEVLERGSMAATPAGSSSAVAKVSGPLPRSRGVPQTSSTQPSPGNKPAPNKPTEIF